MPRHGRNSVLLCRSVRGVSAKHMVEEAREKVADLIKASRPDEIVFVSGGTEVSFCLKVLSFFSIYSMLC